MIVAESENGEDIEVYKNRISTPQFCGLFIESEYRASNGKMNKEYLLTRDGFSFLVMGFTGAKADEWKLKYIEAFNKMEQTIKNPYGHLSKEVQAIFALDHKQQQLAGEVRELKEGMPLFNVECKEIQAAVKRKGIHFFFICYPSFLLEVFSDSILICRKMPVNHSRGNISKRSFLFTF